jgi:glycosyltransferase involved in cell wall biosynthesis
MLAADVFVLASRRESFGLVLIEARQAGCAIVATDVDGVSEALDCGEAGLLVPVRDVQALASALCRILGDEAERSEWKAKARHGIESYCVQQMANEVNAVYDELVSDKRPADHRAAASTEEARPEQANAPPPFGSRLH